MRCHIMACILAGEEGMHLWPLTVDRAKPAIRFGGRYRLLDLTLRNCVSSDIRQILIFPPYQTQSLEDHLRQGWSCLSQGRDTYVMSVPPPRVGHWEYQGTADAVYQHLSLLERINPTHVLILGSDHRYHMDYRRLLQFHQARGADVTVATVPVPRHQASQCGLVTAHEWIRCGEPQRKGMNNCDHTHVLHPTRIEIAPEIRRYVIQLLNYTLACTVDLRSSVKQAYWNVIVV